MEKQSVERIQLIGDKFKAAIYNCLKNEKNSNYINIDDFDTEEIAIGFFVAAVEIAQEWTILEESPDYISGIAAITRGIMVYHDNLYKYQDAE